MPVISSADALSLTRDIIAACGASPEEAGLVAEHLVKANLSGVDSHGLIRIPQYVKDVRDGVIRPGAEIKIVQETAISAVVDCGWNFGMVGADRAVSVALQKAEQQKVALVVTRRCNHAGRLGHYLEKTASAGFVGFGFCSSPLHGNFVAPWGGRDGRLSTNPLAYGIPVAGGGQPIVSDFSTSETPEGKIRLYKNRDEALPEGWILDAEGNPSTSPADFYGPPRGTILPFGGRQGYRGYALGLLVEIMSSILAGNDATVDRPGNGLTFVLFHPTLLVEEETYSQNLQKLAEYVKSSRPRPGTSGVLLPGEPEQQRRKERSAQGIHVDDVTWGQILSTAGDLKLSPIRSSAPNHSGDTR